MRSDALAFSGLAAPEIARLASPWSFAPRYSASSAAVRFMGTSFSFYSQLLAAVKIGEFCFCKRLRQLNRIDGPLAQRARFPPFVDPEPLVGMLANVRF